MKSNFTVRCPHCGGQTSWQDNPSRPFCSERCRLIDFGRWDNEDYAVPGEKAEQESGADDDSDDQ